MWNTLFLAVSNDDYCDLTMQERIAILNSHRQILKLVVGLQKQALIFSKKSTDKAA